MFDKAEEISKNRYINNLTTEVKKFGLFGCYIKYFSDENPVNNGIYFICGFDKERCNDKNNKIDIMYHEQQCSNKARLDWFVIRITDNSPFAVRQAVVSFALHSSTMKGILKKCECHYELNVVSPDFINLSEKLYFKSIDNTLSIEEREKYSFALRSFIHKASKYENENENHLNFDGELQFAEIRENSPKNRVTAQRLLHFEGQAERMIINSKYLHSFESKLVAQPEILYYKSEVVPSKLSIYYHSCLGLKQEPTSYVLFMYGSKFKKEIKTLYLKTIFHNIIKYDIKSFKDKQHSLCSIGVREDDIPHILNLADQIKVPIAIDFDKLFFNGSINNIKEHFRDDCLYTLTFLKRDVQKMDAGLWSITNELSKIRYLNDEDFNLYVKEE